MVSPNISFILSTGRTGTAFLKYYINANFPNFYCTHEPKPSRILKFMSNLYLNGKINKKIIRKYYRQKRKNIFKKIKAENYIESNNFIFGCIPALNDEYDNIKIVHMVRHPMSYIRSHINHGFWQGFKKFTAKSIPYWLENIEIKKNKTSYRNDPIIILAERWKYMNEIIMKYSETNEYLLLKFEDLFSDDMNKSLTTINFITEFYDIKNISIDVHKKWMHQKINKPKNNYFDKHVINEEHKEYIEDRCNRLLHKFGYKGNLFLDKF